VDRKNASVCLPQEDLYCRVIFCDEVLLKLDYGLTYPQLLPLATKDFGIPCRSGRRMFLRLLRNARGVMVLSPDGCPYSICCAREITLRDLVFASIHFYADFYT